MAAFPDPPAAGHRTCTGGARVTAALAADTDFSHVLGEGAVAALGCALPAGRAGSWRRYTSFRGMLPEAARVASLLRFSNLDSYLEAARRVSDAALWSPAGYARSRSVAWSLVARRTSTRHERALPVPARYAYSCSPTCPSLSP